MWAVIVNRMATRGARRGVRGRRKWDGVVGKRAAVANRMRGSYPGWKTGMREGVKQFHWFLLSGLCGSQYERRHGLQLRKLRWHGNWAVGGLGLSYSCSCKGVDGKGMIRWQRGYTS